MWSCACCPGCRRQFGHTRELGNFAGPSAIKNSVFSVGESCTTQKRFQLFAERSRASERHEHIRAPGTREHMFFGWQRL
jgi:hypothetical protein